MDVKQARNYVQECRRRNERERSSLSALALETALILLEAAEARLLKPLCEMNDAEAIAAGAISVRPA